ncbi:hypothetical protein RJT34_16384 [Clitoria ternatea]|uniref:Uncharacterized protein n=1 Tax=Clitoria ternatea TaxID=43366 RepID=A0AAN9J8D9_CLITE
MEVFSKGVHHAIVLYSWLFFRFLKHHVAELRSILARSVKDLGADTEQIYAIADRTTLVDAIKCLKPAMLNIVPIVRASDVEIEVVKMELRYLEEKVRVVGREVVLLFFLQLLWTRKAPKNISAISHKETEK